MKHKEAGGGNFIGPMAFPKMYFPARRWSTTFLWFLILP